MSKKRQPVYFLILNQCAPDKAVVTITVVDVKGGNLKTTTANLKRAIEDSGMWCTQLHPTAAKVLLTECKVSGTTRAKGTLKAPDVIQILQREDE